MSDARRYSLGMEPIEIIGLVWLLGGSVAALIGLLAPIPAASARYVLIAAAFLLIVGAVMTIRMVIRRGKLRRVISEGRFVVAKVTETESSPILFSRNRGLVKSPNPRCVTCVGTDPDTGETRTFRSKSIYMDGFELPSGAEVKVFVGKNGLYYVDIDPLIARHAVNNGRMV